ncbi:MAG: arsenate reductase [Gammaproteobacteria bacterium]|nr:arsenate reductase [Gammaproteobacteria bacterium]MDH4313576.1 arsenate reductase [Gammaproteobacteria bacterium]MDH5212645.1 arsenate reductase [Gammaproteobacteria bacterium]
MLKIYGIGSCDSCRKARKWLDENDRDYKFHDIREDGLDIEMLERWSRRIRWEKLLNTRSLTWRKIPDVDRSGITQSRALSMMLEHPTLVKRPVMEHRRFIAVGFSADHYQQIFSKLD